MRRPRYQQRERVEGLGKVYDAEGLVGWAPYRLRVRVETVPSGETFVEGRVEIDGRVTGHDWEALIQGKEDEPLTLELSDGRRLKIVFTHPIEGYVVGVGDFF